MLLKWILIIFFISLIGLEINHIYDYRYSSTSERRILLLVLLILIIQYKNKYTWSAGILLCSYALYYLIAVAGKYSDFTALDFTARMYSLLQDNFTKGWRIFATGFPIYFYIISIVIFLTPMGRKWYGISFKKPSNTPSIN